MNKLYESEIEEIALDLLRSENGYERETLKVSFVIPRHVGQRSLAYQDESQSSKPLGSKTWNKKNL